MQLRTARLCIDCEEVHDDVRCPVCASETFTYLSRWIPSDERRRRPRNEGLQAEDTGDIESYRRLTSSEPPPVRGRQLLKKGVVGLAALGVVGWLWGRNEANGGAAKPPEQPES
jgi:hypothetical protein